MSYDHRFFMRSRSLGIGLSLWVFALSGVVSGATLNVQGWFGGGVETMVDKGNVVYFDEGGGLNTLSVPASGEAQVVHRNWQGFQSRTQYMLANNQYLFQRVFPGAKSIYVYSLANPLHPSLAGTITEPTGQALCHVRGNVAMIKTPGGRSSS